jgi:hypothetical protein
MSALPSNLLLVGEDLARATSRDARRSLARRCALALSIAVAVLVVTATAAVANGWLFGETPTLRAVPALGAAQASGAFAPGDAVSAIDDLARAEAAHRATTPGTAGQAPLGSGDPSSARTLLSNLGRARRALRSVATSSGGVCLILSGFPSQCVPTLKSGSEIAWYIAPSASPTIIFGIVRDDVESVEAVTADDRSITARLANNAFYLELSDGQATRLVVHLADGSSDDVPLPACPCAK